MLIAAFVAILAMLPALAADKSTIRGLITAIQGDTLTVKDGNNVEHTITVSSDTTYKKTKGLTGAISEKAAFTSLMPGLPIIADGMADGGNFTASAISFKAEDFRTAQQVQAGVAPTSTRVDDMGKRMDDFGTYEALEVLDVHFASGKTALSAKDKAALSAFAEKAKATNGYHVVLQGFTDSVGNAAANQRLSTMRAASVANYLQQTGGLMPGKVHAGDGMGVAADAGSGSNANARKVTVKLVVDKGVQAGNK
jgi:outer membrane protein OmpA-like peptidoglycan-associated protein